MFLPVISINPLLTVTAVRSLSHITLHPVSHARCQCLRMLVKMRRLISELTASPRHQDPSAQSRKVCRGFSARIRIVRRSNQVRHLPLHFHMLLETVQQASTATRLLPLPTTVMSLPTLYRDVVCLPRLLVIVMSLLTQYREGMCLPHLPTTAIFLPTLYRDGMCCWMERVASTISTATGRKPV